MIRRGNAAVLNGFVVSFTAVETKKYVYLGGSVIRELDGNDNVLKEYIRGLELGGGIGGIIYQKKGSAFYYYHCNYKGDVVALTDGNGDLVALYEYDAWGNSMTEAEKSGVENPHRYSTKEWDEKSGLYYFGAGFYSPEIGRWTQRDPAGEVDGLNVYAYVGGDPVGAMDPWGLKLPVDYSATGVFVVTLRPNEPTSEGVLPMIMSADFEPLEVTKKCCSEITIVQAAKTFQRRGASRVWDGWPFTKDSDWHPDPVAKKAYVSNWTPSSKVGAHVYDTPGERWFYVFQAFETCAKCIGGKWAGEILGCFYWSHEIREGRVVHHAPRTKPTGRDMTPRAPRFFR